MIREIPLGWRLCLGVLLPSVNTLAEPQLQAMLPTGVTLHTTRLKLTGSSEAELLAMADKLEEAAMLPAGSEPQRILFHCTAVTTFDPGMAERLRRRIIDATGLPATVTSEALIAAPRTLKAHTIVVLTPYIAAVNQREVALLEHNGLTVLREHGLGLPGGKAFATVEPFEWYRLAMSLRHGASDVYFISCAQVHSAEVIDMLENDLDRPVVTSNQAAMWYSLREGGINDRVGGFGTLFRQ